MIMSLDFLKTEYMVPKGAVINDMVPKDSIYFLVILVCFEIVINDMVPKESQQTCHQSFRFGY